MATTTNNGWTIPASTDYVKDGYAAIDTLGQAIDTSTGKGLIAWQSWSPTLSGGWANGNGVWSNNVYCQLGKIVIVRGSFIVGSTTTKGTNLLVSLPVTAKNAAAVPLDQGASVAYLSGSIGTFYPSTTTTARCLAFDASSTYLSTTQISATVPKAWATGDSITFTLTYEAA